MISCIFILMISILLWADKTIDQKIADLEKKLKNAQGNEKIDVLNELVTKYYYSQAPKKGLEYAAQALQLSRELKNTNGEAAALIAVSLSRSTMGDYKKALEYAQESLNIYQTLNDKKGLSDSLIKVGSAYHDLGNYDKALEHYLEALKIKEEINDKKGLADCLNHIGVTYIHLSDYQKTLQYYLKALEIQEETGNRRGIAIAFSNIGNVYWYLNKFEKALAYYQKALKIFEETGDKNGSANALGNIGNVYWYLTDYEKSLEHFQRAVKIFAECGDKKKIADAFNNIGSVYDKLNNYQKALEYHNKALKIKKEMGEKWGIAYTLSNLGMIYHRLQQYDEAVSNLNQGLEIAKEIKGKDIIRQSYEILSRVYEAKGDYKKALEYHKLYSEIKDTIYNETSSKQIADMQTRYETLKKEKRIAILEKDGEIQELKLSREQFTRNALIVGFGLVLIILGLLFKRYLYFFSFWKKQKYISQFRLMEEVGSGGMGTVYKAHSIRDKTETAAVKVLKPELFKEKNIRTRFKQEGAIIDKLEHPHIVKIIERGEYKEKLFIAMEFLQGKTLDVKIAEEGQMDLKVCLHIMRQVSDALVLIHGKEIVHRDLKPSNIMLIRREGDPDFVKLLDFGLARMKYQTRLTRTGILVGTLNYMSPEQLADSEFSPASDIYSLGATFYEMVVGHIAFPGETATDIMKQVLEKTPVAPKGFRPDMPGELNDLIMKMLEKKKESRPGISKVFETLQFIQAKYKY